MAVGYIILLMNEGKTTLFAVTLMLPVKEFPLGFTPVISIHLHQIQYFVQKYLHNNGILCTDSCIPTLS